MPAKGKKKKISKGLEANPSRPLSDLWRPDKITAFVLSDLHLRLDAPLCRGEKGHRWLSVLEGYFKQVHKALKATRAEVLYAGDIFHDGWRPKNCPPELVNFAIDVLPRGAGIPGQHDLPHHRYADVKKSAFYTLVKTEKIHDISKLVYTLKPLGDDYGARYEIHGSVWSEKLKKTRRRSLATEHLVCLMHRYVWKEGHTHPGARLEDHVDEVTKEIKSKGFSVGIAGDNHRGFCTKEFLVPGGFYRSKSNEADYLPCIGAIYDDMTLMRYSLDVSKDEMVDVAADEDANDKDLIGNDKYIELIEMFDEEKTNIEDFIDEVKIYCKHQKITNKDIKELLAVVLDEAHGGK